MLELIAHLPVEQWLSGLLVIALVAGLSTLLVGVKALLDFSRAGPEIPEEVLKRYRGYSAFAFLRQCGWWFVIQWYLGAIGTVVYAALVIVSGGEFHWLGMFVAVTLAIVLLVFIQFCRHLLYIPSSIVMCFQYRSTRLYGLWRQLSPARIRWAVGGLMAASTVLVAAAMLRLVQQGDWPLLVTLVGAVLVIVVIWVWNSWIPEPAPAKPSSKRASDAPNVVMIGCDTLRVDRLGAMNYQRDLTPNIDKLVDSGTLFSNCYTPLARTAPSLVSLLTGRWPHRHGIRSNFVPDDSTRLNCDTLPGLLKQQGYSTAVIADWGGADLGKIDFGFDRVDVPPDQWNLKYYLRQGPMDLRLGISLFAHGRFGRTCVPEIYYLPGTPLTSHMGRDARSAISDLADSGKPFFLNLFMATAHVPFGSEYPYYLKYSDRDYSGVSKFSMATVSTPGEIVEQQESPASKFDIPQIISLYDGSVNRFDAEVGRIVEHLERSGLKDNTIVVIYSDHGSDFFERDSWGQGNTFAPSDPSARIPLVIVDPRTKGREQPVDAITRAVDLAPTLLDMVGAEVPDDFDGESLLPMIRGEQQDQGLAAYHETGVWLGRLPGMDARHLSYPTILDLLEIRDLNSGTLSLKREFLDRIVQAKDRMIRDGRWKLIYQPMDDGARYQLYDLDADPECMTNLADQQPQVFEDLKRRLVAWMEEDPAMRWDGTYMVPVEAADPK